MAVAATMEWFGSSGIAVVSPAAAGRVVAPLQGASFNSKGLGRNSGSELFPDEI